MSDELLDWVYLTFSQLISWYAEFVCLEIGSIITQIWSLVTSSNFSVFTGRPSQAEGMALGDTSPGYSQ